MKLKEFFLLSDEEIKHYTTTFAVLKPLATFSLKKKTFGVKTLACLSWGEVSELKGLLTSGNFLDYIKAFELVYKCKAAQTDVVIFYRCLNFLFEEIETIIKTENQRYEIQPHKYSHKWIEAGGDALNKFGDLNILEVLSGGDPLKYEAIEKMPYLTIHFILWQRATKTNIENKLLSI